MLPLYARSFGVSQAAIGLVHRHLRTGAVPRGRAGGPALRSARPAPGARARRPHHRGRQSPLRLRAELPHLRGRPVRRRRGAAFVLTAGQIVLADITTPAARGRAMAIYQGSFLFAVGLGPSGGVLAERFGLAAPFVAYAITGNLAGAVAWLRFPRRWRSSGPRRRRRAPPRPAVPGAARSPRRPDRVSPGEPGELRERLHAHGRPVQRHPGPRPGPAAALTPDRIGFALALGSLAGFGFAYPAGMLVDRYGRKAGDRAGHAPDQRVAPPVPAGPVLRLVSRGVPGVEPRAGRRRGRPSGLRRRRGAAADERGGDEPLPDAWPTPATSSGRSCSAWSPTCFGIDAALATGASLLAGVGLLFAWGAPESYDRSGAATVNGAAGRPAAFTVVTEHPRTWPRRSRPSSAPRSRPWPRTS